eukprot:2024467-Rhodomonas_salina.1
MTEITSAAAAILLLAVSFQRDTENSPKGPTVEGGACFQLAGEVFANVGDNVTASKQPAPTSAWYVSSLHQATVSARNCDDPSFAPASLTQETTPKCALFLRNETQEARALCTNKLSGPLGAGWGESSTNVLEKEKA